MNSQTLEEATKILHASQELEKIPDQDPGPLVAVEQALSGFLTHRLRKLQEDTDFEAKIKEALEARISEAGFDDLMKLLSIVQTNNNMGVEKVLTPFLNNNAVSVSSSRTGDVGDQIFKDSSKELLQAFEELNRFVGEVAKVKKSEAEKIKEAISPPETN